MNLDKRFNFKDVDAKWSKHWVDHNSFHAEPSKKKPYVITIPPPNITGILHMGHALNNTLQDIIIRYKRMNGYEACWMPGTDHAGIATQNVVERELAKEGTNRHELGREKLLERLWAWKDSYGDTIINQLKTIGASCDWPRTSFTMDNGYSEAVTKVFICLYEKGLIYQGERIIHWCPRCHTALSDEECEHKESNGSLTYIKYPLKNSTNAYITVATTRPETMLGDTGVAVNPKDPRYKNYIGQTLVLPLMGREIPVVADEFVDPEFGTGAVKVTPAHDPNDFEMGKRHDLPFINIMNEDGSINKNGGDYVGEDRFTARKAIVEKLKSIGAFEKQVEHHHAVGHCYRCHAVVEPRLSKQWFVKMEPLAKPAIKAVKSGKIKFHPARWEKTYMSWMDNIRDWCISRQIWWGHRIPVWYDEEGNHCAAYNEEEAKKKLKTEHIRQDEDVLDTWFSSWLWPFATFGWPKDNKDLKFFYPGDGLFTASEIIFFWVARMIMAGYEFMGELPFKDVFIHGTVRAADGQKMSKSLGNSIDPLDIIDEYGADALRFSLIYNSGQDLYISKDNFEVGRNFANKVWNASRLILMNVNYEKVAKMQPLQAVKTKEMDLATQWIVSKYYTTLENVSTAIESYKYSEAENHIYDFFWNCFCDWYLEIIKNKWDDEQAQNVAYKLLEETLIMMNPFIPFVTEEIWETINKDKGLLCDQDWPQIEKKLINTKAEAEFQTLMDIVTAIRNIRATWNINPKEKVLAHIETKGGLHIEHYDLIKSRANVDEILEAPTEKNAAAAVVGNIKISVPLGDVIDLAKEKARIVKTLEGQKKAVSSLTGRLNNKNFLDKAPDEVVKKEKARLLKLETECTELEAVISGLK